MTATVPLAALLAIPHTPMGRIRLALAVLSALVVLVTFESIRRTKLKERYALLWILPCVLLVGLIAFPGVLGWMQSTFGLSYASSISAVVFVSVLVAAFVLSGAISSNERNLARIAQRCAMLEARLRALEHAEDAGDESRAENAETAEK